MVLADVHLSDLIWTSIWIFFLIMFIWVFIAIVSDLFRDNELSGAAKAVWVVALIIFPLLGSLVYLIARGQGMTERSARCSRRCRPSYDRSCNSWGCSGAEAQPRRGSTPASSGARLA